MKLCKKCKLEKEIYQFHKDKTQKDGLRKWCKECRHLHFQSVADIKAIYDKTYFETNRLFISKRNKEYRLKNKERLKIKQNEWREKNKEKIINWKKNHPDYFREYNAKWRKQNIQKVKITKHKRRMAKLKINGSHTVEEWLTKLKAAKGWCPGHNRASHYVGQAKLTKDHIIPLQPKQGNPGTDYISNIQVLCRACNAAKGNRTYFKKEVSNV